MALVKRSYSEKNGELFEKKETKAVSSATLNLVNLGTKTFSEGETVKGQSSGATATVDSYSDGTLNVSNAGDGFSSGETVKGQSSGATGDIDSMSETKTTLSIGSKRMSKNFIKDQKSKAQSEVDLWDQRLTEANNLGL